MPHQRQDRDGGEHVHDTTSRADRLRLSSLDASFLTLEHMTTPMHMGALLLFRAEHEHDPARLVPRLVATLRDRVGAIPELHCRLRIPRVPWAPAEWIDDTNFDP